MKRLSAYTLGIFGFVVCGALSGSITSYVVTYWGAHSPMIRGLQDAEGRRVAIDIVLSNLTFGVVFAIPPALSVAVLATLMFHLIGNRLNLVAFAGVCGLVGAGLSYLFAGSSEAIASPVSAGATASVICGVLLFLFLSAVAPKQVKRGSHELT